MLETCHRAGCAKVLKSLNVPLDITFASQMFTPHLPRNLPSRIVCSSNSMWVPTTLPANKKGHQPVFMKYNDEILYTSLAIFAWHFSHLLVICVSPSPSLVHGTLQVAPTLVPGLCRLFLHFLDFSRMFQPGNLPYFSLLDSILKIPVERLDDTFLSKNKQFFENIYRKSTGKWIQSFILRSQNPCSSHLLKKMSPVKPSARIKPKPWRWQNFLESAKSHVMII